jgi:hypothetical protein
MGRLLSEIICVFISCYAVLNLKWKHLVIIVLRIVHNTKHVPTTVILPRVPYRRDARYF